jgi:hypothetical protein
VVGAGDTDGDITIIPTTPQLHLRIVIAVDWINRTNLYVVGTVCDTKLQQDE